MVISLEGYVLTLSHILISVCGEGMEMLIDRTLPDIASTRVGDLECAESLQKGREEEYSDADLLDLLTIQMLYR